MAKTSGNGAKEFADLVDKDPEVREEVREAAGAILEVAKKHGYKFTGDQMQAYLTKKWRVRKRKPGGKGHGDDCDPKDPKDEDDDYPDDQDDPLTTWCWSETPGY